MITKAILELNACVNTLYYLRTSSCALHYVYYDHICCDRFEGMAGRMFKARKYYDMRAILQKATDYTAGQIYSMDELNVFIEDYLKKNNVIVPNKVADALVEYYHDTDNECRRCSICGRLMQEGYCQDGGWRYYCSDDCLHHDFTDEEWNKECDNNDQSYWTQWY